MCAVPRCDRLRRFGRWKLRVRSRHLRVVHELLQFARLQRWSSLRQATGALRRLYRGRRLRDGRQVRRQQVSQGVRVRQGLRDHRAALRLLHELVRELPPKLGLWRRWPRVHQRLLSEPALRAGHDLVHRQQRCNVLGNRSRVGKSGSLRQRVAFRSAIARLPSHSAWLHAGTLLDQSWLGGCAAKWIKTQCE